MSNKSVNLDNFFEKKMTKTHYRTASVIYNEPTYVRQAITIAIFRAFTHWYINHCAFLLGPCKTRVMGTLHKPKYTFF